MGQALDFLLSLVSYCRTNIGMIGEIFQVHFTVMIKSAHRYLQSTQLTKDSNIPGSGLLNMM